MVVDVDETRREHEAVRVDHLFASIGRKVAHLGDAVARDTYAPLVQCGARAVCDLRVGKDGRDRLVLSSGRQCNQQTAQARQRVQPSYALQLLLRSSGICARWPTKGLMTMCSFARIH